MLNALSTAEIQALRLNLQLFASRQTDQTVRSQCLAVDTRLGEALGGVGERYAVADQTVALLKERGDPWRLRGAAMTVKG